MQLRLKPAATVPARSAEYQRYESHCAFGVLTASLLGWDPRFL